MHSTPPPSLQWDAYGHGLRELAPAAKAAADSIGVLWNWEAAEVAAAVDSPVRGWRGSAMLGRSRVGGDGGERRGGSGPTDPSHCMPPPLPAPPTTQRRT